jgi:hypothetical protein
LRRAIYFVARIRSIRWHDQGVARSAGAIDHATPLDDPDASFRHELERERIDAMLDREDARS